MSPCGRCAELDQLENRCHDCRRPVPVYPGMFGAGFESRTVDHFHPIELGRFIVDSPVHRQLCLTCYRRDQWAHGERPLCDPPFADIETEVVGIEG